MEPNTNKTIKKFKCEECDLSYDRPNKLRSHIETRHNGVFFACSGCSGTITTNIKRHLSRCKKGAKLLRVDDVKDLDLGAGSIEIIAAPSMVETPPKEEAKKEVGTSAYLCACGTPPPSLSPRRQRASLKRKLEASPPAI